MATEQSTPSESGGRSFRWQALFQRSGEALFVLDRRRRLLFVNAAWEQLTGLGAERARGLVCRRPRPAGPDDPIEDVLAHALTPPAEAAQGHFARVRRLFARSTGAAGPRLPCDVEFFPLRLPAPPGGHVLVGRVLPVAGEASPPQNTLLPERLEGLRQRQAGRFGLDLLHSAHPAMQRLVRQVRLAMQVGSPVLLVGEPGSGKQTVARIIHYNGPSRERAFAALDARRLPASALADVLLADRSGPMWSALGAIYVAGPDCLPRDLQLRLCEWLAADPAAGPRLFLGVLPDVQEQVRSGRLLAELYWQASALTIETPPLRQRHGDLPELVERLLGGPVGLTPAAWELLRGYGWPGNLAELRQVLDTARRRLGEGRVAIDATDLPSALRLARDTAAEQGRAAQPRSLLLEDVLAEVERRLIRQALERAGGNRSRAADLLGIHRLRLLRRIEALGLDADPTSGEG